MNRTERIHRIEQLLLKHPQGLRAIEISQMCGVDRRTIYRDLEYMQESLDIPIWQERGHFGIVQEEYIPHIGLNFDETVMLMLSARHFMRLTGNNNPHLQSALQKVLETLPPALREKAAAQLQLEKHDDTDRENMPSLSSSSPIPSLSPSPRTKAVLDKLLLAMQKEVKIKISYTTDEQSGATRHILAPYVLETGENYRLQVIGHDHHSGEVKTFQVQNIQRIKLLEDRPYKIPQKFFWNSKQKDKDKDRNRDKNKDMKISAKQNK